MTSELIPNDGDLGEPYFRCLLFQSNQNRNGILSGPCRHRMHESGFTPIRCQTPNRFNRSVPERGCKALAGTVQCKNNPLPICVLYTILRKPAQFFADGLEPSRQLLQHVVTLCSILNHLQGVDCGERFPGSIRCHDQEDTIILLRSHRPNE